MTGDHDLRRSDTVLGSLARDHLANERTLLAWLRTGLGTVGLGLLAAKFVGNEVSLLVGGFVLVAIGAAMLVYGTTRYIRTGQLLEQDRFAAARVAPVLFGAVLLAVTAGVGTWILLGVL